MLRARPGSGCKGTQPPSEGRGASAPRWNRAPTAQPVFRFARAFTLIELILVMAILTIAVSLTAPALSNFFHGRSLDSEARRLLALTRQGQSRAVSEGVPMELWVDGAQRSYGLEAEPSYEPADRKKEQFTLENDMQIEAVSRPGQSTGASLNLAAPAGSASTPRASSNHPSVPSVRFLPDGSISESSPVMIRLTGRDEVSLFVVQSRNRMNYEIRNRAN